MSSCKLFNENEAVIKEYCTKNGLNFDFAKSSPKTFNDIEMFIQYYNESESKGLGLLDETPMPVILKIIKTANGLLFEQTEHTARYLAV